jgi:hypothetical protein
MINPFVGLKETSEISSTIDPLVWKLADQNPRQQREALYAEYTPMVYDVLDHLIDASLPEVWEKGSDCNHPYCNHCRWYAGPEETHHTAYDDREVRRLVEIELEIDTQGRPTGFKILFYGYPSKWFRVGLSQDELVRGIKAFLYSL